MRLKLPLLARLVLTLAAAGLLPLAISAYLLLTSKDALLTQVRRTHMVAASTTTERVEIFLDSVQSLSKMIAQHPAMQHVDPHSSAAQELLRGAISSHPGVAAIGVYRADGENIMLAQRPNTKELIGELGDVLDGPQVQLTKAGGGIWLRLREARPNERGHVILVVDAEPLKTVVTAAELGDEAHLVLARDEEVLLGDVDTLDTFPREVVEMAKSGKLSSLGNRSDELETGEAISAYALVAPRSLAQRAFGEMSWYVISRQPAYIAEQTQERIRGATLVAVVGAVLLTAVFSTGAYFTLVQPVRRLARAQQQLVGAAESTGGYEIEQLEASFELLQQRIQDREDLGQVYLGRYQVQEQVGSGAMGSVFRGKDPKLRREVALKTLRVDAELLDHEKLVRSLLDEAALSARFSHPNIVTVYDVVEGKHAAVIAMEYVDGLNLHSFLSRRGTLDPDQVICLGIAIARALAAAHEHEVVHHDVKPANILLGRDGSIKVTDFGISQLVSAAAKAQDVICGTPGYIAPECFVGEGYTPSSDLFALGLVLYEALMGKHPFIGLTIRETMFNTVSVEPEPIIIRHPRIPPKLDELITLLLAKEPRDRPKDATAVVAALEELIAERQPQWQPVGLSPRPPKRRPEVAKTQLFTMPEIGEK